MATKRAKYHDTPPPAKTPEQLAVERAEQEARRQAREIESLTFVVPSERIRCPDGTKPNEWIHEALTWGVWETAKTLTLSEVGIKVGGYDSVWRAVLPDQSDSVIIALISYTSVAIALYLGRDSIIYGGPDPDEFDELNVLTVEVGGTLKQDQRERELDVARYHAAMRAGWLKGWEDRGDHDAG